jgi:hypothetical protein
MPKSWTAFVPEAIEIALDQWTAGRRLTSRNIGVPVQGAEILVLKVQGRLKDPPSVFGPAEAGLNWLFSAILWLDSISTANTAAMAANCLIKLATATSQNSLA